MWTEGCVYQLSQVGSDTFTMPPVQSSVETYQTKVVAKETERVTIPEDITSSPCFRLTFSVIYIFENLSFFL